MLNSRLGCVEYTGVTPVLYLLKSFSFDTDQVFEEVFGGNPRLGFPEILMFSFRRYWRKTANTYWSPAVTLSVDRRGEAGFIFEFPAEMELVAESGKFGNLSQG